MARAHCAFDEGERGCLYIVYLLNQCQICKQMPNISSQFV